MIFMTRPVLPLCVTAARILVKKRLPFVNFRALNHRFAPNNILCCIDISRSNSLLYINLLVGRDFGDAGRDFGDVGRDFGGGRVTAGNSYGDNSNAFDDVNGFYSRGGSGGGGGRGRGGGHSGGGGYGSRGGSRGGRGGGRGGGLFVAFFFIV